MFLVTWMGVTSGSYAGRDDGYPEQKMALVAVKDLHRYAGFRQLQVYTVDQMSRQKQEEYIGMALAAEKKKKADHEKAIKDAKSKLSPNEQRLLGIRE